MGRKITIEPGTTFGRLTVLGETKRRDKSGNIYYLCKCSCGTEKEISGSCLRRGLTISCGCYNREVISKEHKVSGTPLYQVYESMKHRCLCKTDKSYHNYGGRGIKVSDEWLNGFEHFSKWAVENGYRKGLWLDRINNDGDYSPENCRWTTPKIQQRNKRVNVFVEINGVTKCIADWAEENGIKHMTVYSRWKSGCRGEALIRPIDVSRSHPKTEVTIKW